MKIPPESNIVYGPLDAAFLTVALLAGISALTLGALCASLRALTTSAWRWVWLGLPAAVAAGLTSFRFQSRRATMNTCTSAAASSI